MHVKKTNPKTVGGYNIFEQNKVSSFKLVLDSNIYCVNVLENYVQ